MHLKLLCCSCYGTQFALWLMLCARFLSMRAPVMALLCGVMSFCPVLCCYCTFSICPALDCCCEIFSLCPSLNC